MTDAAPLDPDEVRCRRCGAPPADVCRQPNGDRARSIHAVRRRDAADGIVDAQPANDPQPSRIRDKAEGSSSFTSETAAAAAKKSAQERRRRRAEAAAQVEAQREAAQREAIEDEAAALAKDAVRYDRDRALLKRQTLDAAGLAYTRLIEGLDGLQRVKVDDEGIPLTRPIETGTDKDGAPIVKEVPDVRGAYPAAMVERLAKIAASTLVSLRLEEDKPTGITDNRGSGERAADVLGAAGVDELLEWAKDNLPGAPS